MFLTRVAFGFTLICALAPLAHARRTQQPAVPTATQPETIRPHTLDRLLKERAREAERQRMLAQR